MSLLGAEYFLLSLTLLILVIGAYLLGPWRWRKEERREKEDERMEKKDRPKQRVKNLKRESTLRESMLGEYDFSGEGGINLSSLKSKTKVEAVAKKRQAKKRNV